MIYKGKYEGLYCQGCEKFLTEKELVEGLCPDHKVAPQKIKEENYFFRFSKYQEKLLELYKSNPEFVVPESRLNEMKAFVSGGVEDFSISRLKDKMPWGVPVPGDEDHVMYVWFDALVNYISTLGWPSNAYATPTSPEATNGVAEDKLGRDNFQKFWQDGYSIQFAGKDQIRFQSIMWQAMLHSVGIKNTDQIFYHGFITSGGQKMSKSVGNVINPFDVTDEYGTDALRYYLLRHIHPYDDSDFTIDKFKESYNAHLANGLGNLVSRVMKMVVDYDVVYKELPSKSDVWESPFGIEYSEHLKNYEYNKALDHVWSMINGADLFIAENEPFKVVKVDIEKGRALVSKSILDIYGIAVLLEPIMPETSIVIQRAIEKREKPDSLFVRK